MPEAALRLDVVRLVLVVRGLLARGQLGRPQNILSLLTHLVKLDAVLKQRDDTCVFTAPTRRLSSIVNYVIDDSHWEMRMNDYYYY